MKIYLGLEGSEQLITSYGREFTETEKEIYEDITTVDESIFRYSQKKTKKYFEFRYSLIEFSDLEVVLGEYKRFTTLSLKIENVVSGTYSTYKVLFDSEISKQLYTDFSGKRYYANVSFTLREV